RAAEPRRSPLAVGADLTGHAGGAGPAPPRRHVGSPGPRRWFCGAPCGDGAVDDAPAGAPRTPQSQDGPEPTAAPARGVGRAPAGYGARRAREGDSPGPSLARASSLGT